jgi:hypothetical protein
MRPREVVTEISIPADVFMDNVKERILAYKNDTVESLFSVEPHFQWNNVRLKGNKLVIERSAKPFDKSSKYRGVSGIIESEIITENNKTILRARITLDTAMAVFFKYAVGLSIGTIGLFWLALDFNYVVLCLVILFEGFIFGVIPLIQSDSLNDLTDYYHSVIRVLTRQ